MVFAHDHVPKLSEKAALKGLREEIREHLLGGAMLDIDVFEVDPVFDENIPDIYGPGIGAALLSPVLLEPHGALIVLVKNGFLDQVSLVL